MVACGACRRGPTAEERARLLDEVHAEDAKRRASVTNVAEPWVVEIRTDAPGVRRTLGFDELARRATETLTTVGPSPGAGFGTPNAYRGVRLSHLLDGVDAGSGASVTLVGEDGYFTRIAAEDVMRYPVLVAVERDGKPLARSDGGPVLAALPLSQVPDLAARYGADGFCFYLKGIIVGRPAARLSIEDRPYGPEELAAKSVTRHHEVRFRRGWSAGAVDVVGPRLASLVTSKGPFVVTTFGGREGIVVTREELDACDPLLVIGRHPATEPLSTDSGGPILLAPLPSCKAPWAVGTWPAFVDGVEVRR